MTTDLYARYPLSSLDKDTQAKLKQFYTTPSRIVEVSFPNPRVNVLKIVTDDFTLFISKVSAKDKEHYILLGKTLADIFKEHSKGDVKPCPEMTLTLDKSKIANVKFDWEKMSQWKMKADGWYAEQNEEAYVDFFTL